MKKGFALVYMLIIVSILGNTNIVLANKLTFKNYIQNEILNNEEIIENEIRKEELENKKRSFFDISRVSSYGEYNYGEFYCGDITLGFNTRLYDRKESLNDEKEKLEITNLDLGTERIKINIIQYNISDYLDYCIFNIMDSILYNFIKNIDDEELIEKTDLDYNDLMIKYKKNKINLNLYYSFDEFMEIYNNIGMNIFVEDIKNIIKNISFYEIIKNNYEINNNNIFNDIKILEEKMNKDYPSVYLDGCYQYDFDTNNNEFTIGINIDYNITSKLGTYNMDISIDRNRINYNIDRLNWYEEKNNINQEMLSTEEVVRRLQFDYNYYLDILEVYEMELENINKKLNKYSIDIGNIKPAKIIDYINLKYEFYNTKANIFNTYVTILSFGGSEIILDSLN